MCTVCATVHRVIHYCADSATSCCVACARDGRRESWLEARQRSAGLCPGTCLWRPGHNGRVTGRRPRCWHRLIKAGWMTPPPVKYRRDHLTQSAASATCDDVMHCHQSQTRPRSILPSITSASSLSPSDKMQAKHRLEWLADCVIMISEH